MMEDPMDENKDDRLGPRVEIGRKKNKIKIRKPRGGSGFLVQQTRRKLNKWEKEGSGACLQPYVRNGMVYFDKLT